MSQPLKNQHVRNIPLDLIFTLITCFLYNSYLQYKQCQAINDMLQEYRYSFMKWVMFTLLTCGLYHIYFEYRKSSDVALLLKKDEASQGLIAVLLSMFGMSIINDAIVQADINSFYGNNPV